MRSGDLQQPPVLVNRVQTQHRWKSLTLVCNTAAEVWQVIRLSSRGQCRRSKGHVPVLALRSVCLSTHIILCLLSPQQRATVSVSIQDRAV